MRQLTTPTTAIRAAVLAALLPALTPAGAVSYSWVGGAVGTPTSWGNLLNWQPQQRPRSAADTALLFPDSFVASVNDIADNFQFNQITAFAAPIGAPKGTLSGLSLLPAGTDPQVFVGGAGILTINAALVGSGAWSKTGPGDLVLGGNNAGASGEVGILGGRIEALSAGTLGSGAITVASGATLRSGGTQTFGGIAGAGTWQAGGNVTLNPASGERRFDGPASGTVALTKTGAGRQLFSGILTLAGSVNVSGGELALGGAAARLSGTTTATVSNGAKASLSDGAQWTASGFLTVGGTGNPVSLLALSGGSSFTASSSLIGVGNGETGRVTVDGGSTWVSNGLVTLGGIGSGQLDLSNASTARGISATLGGNSRASGTLNVASGSSMTLSSILTVGSGGRGQVDIGTGGSLSSASTELGSQSQAIGSVVLSGTGSRWTAGALTVGANGRGGIVARQGVVDSANSALGAVQGSLGSASFSDGAQWNVAGLLNVGKAGEGILTLDTGAALKSPAASMGLVSGGSGQVTLDGRSSWTASGPLTVGQAGRGTLSVLGLSTLTTGAATVAQLLEAGGLNGASSVRLDQGDWTVGGELRVADAGIGSVTLQNGSLLNTSGAVLGHGPASDGTVTLDATRGMSTWINSGALTIGRQGTGTVNLLGNVKLNTGSTVVGANQGGSGGLSLLPIAGLGPLLTVSGTLDVGQDGYGAMRIGGGTLSSGAAAIGASPAGGGSVTVQASVQGEQALWLIDGGLTVGSSDPGRVGGQLILGAGGEVRSNGLLVIAPNGQVTLQGGRLSVAGLAPYFGGSLDWTGGTLAITGPDGVALGSTPYLGRVLSLGGSQALDVSNKLNVGNGTLVLSDQAQVRAGTLALAGGQIVGSSVQTFAATALTGRGIVSTPVAPDSGLSITATGGTLLVGDVDSPGGLGIGGPVSVDRSSRLVLASGGEALLRKDAILREGASLQSFNGLRLSAGALMQADGQATVFGRFVNDGAVAGPARGSSVLTFNDDVSGGGNFFGQVRFNQRYAPGVGVRLDDLGLADTARLVLGDLGIQARNRAPLVVGDLAELDGTLDLRFDPAYAPDAGGSSLVLIEWGRHSGSFASLSIEGLASGWTAQLRYDSDALRLAVTAVPEPASWLLGLVGAAGLLAHRRLRARASGPSTR